MTPKYSICICNYNMADTIGRAMTSVLSQLDDRFEVVVVDDGSSDASVAELKKLQATYPALRVISLPRDSKRQLGATRNFSITEARGDYVLLHIDCDDVYDPYLKDFVEVFHQIEAARGNSDFLLSGMHINMGKRAWLLERGPYRNMHRGEDRNLWVRLAHHNQWIPLDHINFAVRLPKTKRQTAYRFFHYTWDHLQNDFRSGAKLRDFYRYELQREWHEMSWRMRLLRLLIAPAAAFSARLKPRLLATNESMMPERFRAYRDGARGTFPQLVRRFGKEPDFNRLSAEARRLFA